MTGVPDSYRFFTPGTAATFRAVAACIVPSEPGSPGADTDEALALADRAIAERPAKDKKLLSAFLAAVERLPILRYGRPFRRLSREQQVAFLHFVEKNPWLGKLRQGFFGLKTFALLGYFGLERTWHEIDYPGPKLDAPYYQLRRDAS